jgi:hypothetical protein
MASGTYKELAAEAKADPRRRARIEQEKARALRRYNRPSWRLVRRWDWLRRR